LAIGLGVVFFFVVFLAVVFLAVFFFTAFFFEAVDPPLRELAAAFLRPLPFEAVAPPRPATIGSARVQSARKTGS
jgi:hypothetical protein